MATFQTRRVLLCFLLGACAYSQSAGRFEEAKRMGMAFIRSEQFDKAAGRLEEVWEQDQSDPTVGENLAVAYLNTEDKTALPSLEKQAFEVIDHLIAANARVTFLVQHSHEKMSWLQGRELNNYCTGRLSTQGRRVIFTAVKGERAAEHSFDLGIADLKKVELAKNDSRGLFEIKTPDRTYVMASRNRNRNEARYIVSALLNNGTPQK